MYPLGGKVYEALRQHQHPHDGGLKLELTLGVFQSLIKSLSPTHSSGIKRSGTSHLLLTKDEHDTIQRESNKIEGATRAAFYNTPFTSEKNRKQAEEAMRCSFLRWSGIRFTAADFESVSPIAFKDLQELSAKLESLKPVRQAPTDNSAANRAFQHGERPHRGQFENSRYGLMCLPHPYR